MSFDTEFNYTPMVNRLTDKLRVYEEMLTQLELTKDDNDSSAQRPHLYESRKLSYRSMIDNCDNAIDEIEAVEALSQEDKLILWLFYAHSRASIYAYMRIIAHNHKEMLADNDIIMARGEVTAESKAAGAIILSKYNAGVV